jgi:hypothetical protein
VGGHGLASAVRHICLPRGIRTLTTARNPAPLPLARFRPDTESGLFFDLLRRTDRIRHIPQRLVSGLGANPLQTSPIY